MDRHLYYLANKQEIKERYRLWAIQNKERLLIYRRNYEKTHPIYVKKRTFLVTRKKKIALLETLGGAYCVRCDFTDIDCLEFDHINDDAREDKKRFNHNRDLYKYYFEHPDEAKHKLQVLCANCNVKKRALKYRETWDT